MEDGEFIFLLSRGMEWGGGGVGMTVQGGRNKE